MGEDTKFAAQIPAIQGKKAAEGAGREVILNATKNQQFITST